MALNDSSVSYNIPCLPPFPPPSHQKELHNHCLQPSQRKFTEGNAEAKLAWEGYNQGVLWAM